MSQDFKPLRPLSDAVAVEILPNGCLCYIMSAEVDSDAKTVFFRPKVRIAGSEFHATYVPKVDK